MNPALALRCAYEVERTLQGVAAAKRRDPRVAQMENRTARALRKIFRRIAGEVMARLEESQATPSNDLDRSRILQPLLDGRGDFMEAVGDAAEAAARHGSRRMGAHLKRGRRGTRRRGRGGRGGRKAAEKKVKPVKPPAGAVPQGPLPVRIPDRSWSFGEPSKRVLEIVRSGAIDSGTMSYSRYGDEILASLETSYSDGKGIYETAEDLKGVLDGMEHYEMERIARTTVNGAQNRGAYESLRDNAIQYQQWWTAEDDCVRGLDPADSADHVSMHGQIVEVGRPFSNGLYYPGDQSGPIEEWISCRCVLLPYLMPEGMAAPPGADYFYESDLVPVAEAA